MNILILHGIMGKAGENWSQWLSDELKAKGFNVVMPTLPNPDHPDRKEWLNFISNIMDELGEQTIIVAHSLGVTSSLDYLEADGNNIKGLVSASGFADDYGLEINSYFMKEKSIDFDKVNNNVATSYVIYGDDDPYVPQASLKLLADNLKVDPTIIAKGGHLNEAAGFTELPQILDFVLSV